MHRYDVYSHADIMTRKMQKKKQKPTGFNV